MRKTEEAVAGFRSGFSCSSVVFSTFSKEMGLDSKAAKKIACTACCCDNALPPHCE